eukprot:4753769-Pyramimonas_sp.AAC.1
MARSSLATRSAVSTTLYAVMNRSGPSTEPCRTPSWTASFATTRPEALEQVAGAIVQFGAQK